MDWRILVFYPDPMNEWMNEWTNERTNERMTTEYENANVVEKDDIFNVVLH